MPPAPGAPAAVRALAKAGSWKEALDEARSAIRLGADRTEILLSLAEGALEGGRADRALKALDQLGPSASVQAIELAWRAWAKEEGQAQAEVRLRERVASLPQDAAIDALVQRLLPGRTVRGTLPLESVSRAVRVRDAGHPGRALRLMRRLQVDRGAEPGVREALLDAVDACLKAGDALEPILQGVNLPEAAELYVEVEPLEMGPA